MFHAVSMTLSTCCGSAAELTTTNGERPSCTMRASSSSAGWVSFSFMSGKSSTPKHGWSTPSTPAARESSLIRRISTLEMFRSPSGTSLSLASCIGSSSSFEILLRNTFLHTAFLHTASRILVEGVGGTVGKAEPLVRLLL